MKSTLKEVLLLMLPGIAALLSVTVRHGAGNPVPAGLRDLAPPAAGSLGVLAGTVLGVLSPPGGEYRPPTRPAWSGDPGGGYSSG